MGCNVLVSLKLQRFWLLKREHWVFSFEQRGPLNFSARSEQEDIFIFVRRVPRDSPSCALSGLCGFSWLLCSWTSEWTFAIAKKGFGGDNCGISSTLSLGKISIFSSLILQLGKVLYYSPLVVVFFPNGWKLWGLSQARPWGTLGRSSRKVEGGSVVPSKVLEGSEVPGKGSK